MRRHLRLALLAIAVGLLLCAIPRDPEGAEFGRPFIVGDRWPLKAGGHISVEEFRESLESRWQNGQIGPNGAHLHGGWYLFRISYGSLIALDVYGLAGNVLLGVTSVVGVNFLIGVWRRKYDPRCRKGHCKHCGYDLSGNESGVCPECGSPAADKAN